MVQTNPMTKTVGLERSVMPAPADPRTTTESRQSLALDETPPSSLPNIIYGQEPFPLEQYHRKTDEPRSDIVVRYTGNSPRRGGLRRLFNFIRRPRSTGSKKLHKSRIDPEPPSLPPLTLGSSILDDLLHEESPVFQSVLGTPEMPDPEFARMSSVTNGTRGIGTKLQPFEDVYGSPSTMGDSTDVPKDDIGSSKSTSPDSDGPWTDGLPPEGAASIMDLPATGQFSSERSLQMVDIPMATTEQFPDNSPVTLAGSTAGPVDPLRRRRKVTAIRNELRRRKGELVATAWTQPPVVLGPPRSGIRYGGIDLYPSSAGSFVSASPSLPQRNNKFAAIPDHTFAWAKPTVVPGPPRLSGSGILHSDTVPFLGDDGSFVNAGEQVAHTWACAEPTVVPGPPRPSGSGIQYGDIVLFPSDDGSFVNAGEQVGLSWAWAEPTVVVGPPRPSGSGIQHGDIVFVPSDDEPVITTSKHNGSLSKMISSLSKVMKKHL